MLNHESGDIGGSEERSMVIEYITRAHVLLFNITGYEKYVREASRYGVDTFRFIKERNHFIVRGKYKEEVEEPPQSLLVSVQSLADIRDYKFMNLYISENAHYINVNDSKSRSMNTSLGASRAICEEILNLLIIK